MLWKMPCIVPVPLEKHILHDTVPNQTEAGPGIIWVRIQAAQASDYAPVNDCGQLNIFTVFEELTTKVSSADALASDVIPAASVLMRLTTKEANEEHGIKTMKGKLASAVKRCFTDLENKPTLLHCYSTQPQGKFLYMHVCMCVCCVCEEEIGLLLKECSP